MSDSRPTQASGNIVIIIRNECYIRSTCCQMSQQGHGFNGTSSRLQRCRNA
jgi:hypothetical protein